MWKPKIQTQREELREGVGTNLGVFIRMTSFSYSFKEEGQSMIVFLIFQITREKNTNTEQKQSLEEFGRTKLQKKRFLTLCSFFRL